MTREEFETLVTETVDSLPEEFGKRLDNVEIVVEEWPTMEQLQTVGAGPGSTLYGLYQGVPLTKRGNYNAAVPDQISIFAGPILMAAGPDPLRIKNQIRHTVLHEIGHYFGMNEDQIRRAQH